MQEIENDSILENDFNDKLNYAMVEISKWSKLIAVIGFAVGAFVVVIMLFSGAAIFEKITASITLPVEGLYGALIFTFFIFFFILAAVLYFLYKGSTLLQEGVRTKDSYKIAESFNFFKKFFLITAIYNAIGLIGYIITLLN
ncbi:MAG: hypothetical protein ABS67_02630 [Niabella sp. SCN 42-15]|nr:MAG: hypothetical protein ABS67_02630 [Niabella sp. SCN 42-15]